MQPVPDIDVLVVGAALVRHGRVLATRRTHPAHAAGRWEFPGGKVEPGESPEDAVVREVREELRCEVVVTGMLQGSQAIKPGYTLRVALAELVDGEPVPHEHDAMRWLGPEDLADVDWLEPDLPFLDELREVLLDGHRLEGGNVGGAVRIGRTVRRPVGPWTPAVHRLLDHVHAQGLRATPRVLGTDARDREVLTYVPGRIVDVNDELLTDAQLVDLTRWIRELHDATTGGPARGPGGSSTSRAPSSWGTTTSRRTTWSSTATASSGSSTGTSPARRPGSSSSRTSRGPGCRSTGPPPTRTSRGGWR